MIQPIDLLHSPPQKLPLPCPVLTHFLNGGLPFASITELSGESATGKTQFCLHLLLALPPPSLSLFIHSDFPFPLRRLLILTQSQSHLDRILVAGAHSPSDLLSLLSHARRSLLPSLLSSSTPVKLLVVDSIASLFRAEFDNTPTDLKRRSTLFFKIAAILKEIAAKFQLAVLVTNHVVDAVDGGEMVRVGNYQELWSSGRRVWPALGIAWANCVNVRLFLSRNDEVVGVDGEGGEEEEVCMMRTRTRTRRRIQVVFAPHLPQRSADFVIVKEGVFGVSL